MFSVEDNTVYSVNDPVVSEVEDKEKFTSVERSEGECQNLTGREAIYSSKTAVGEGYLDGSENTKEQVSVLNHNSS